MLERGRTEGQDLGGMQNQEPLCSRKWSIDRNGHLVRTPKTYAGWLYIKHTAVVDRPNAVVDHPRALFVRQCLLLYIVVWREKRMEKRYDSGWRIPSHRGRKTPHKLEEFRRQRGGSTGTVQKHARRQAHMHNQITNTGGPQRPSNGRELAPTLGKNKRLFSLCSV